MRKIKKENGITMIVLVITIMVLTLIAAITINYSITGANYSKEKQLLADLEAVHHAIYEQYAQYQTTGDISFIIGTKCTQNQMQILHGKKIINTGQKVIAPKFITHLIQIN